MKKKFNITGVCYPHLHYMMDTSQKLKEVMAMVEEGEYFIINRPRQYGKTTTLFLLAEELTKSADYIAIEMNFQGIDEQWHESDQAFAQMFLNQLQKSLEYGKPEANALVNQLEKVVTGMDALSDVISELVRKLRWKNGWISSSLFFNTGILLNSNAGTAQKRIWQAWSN